MIPEVHLRDLPGKTETADVQFHLRDYRSTDFERLWQIDQLCFPHGIAYTQMELSGFIARRNAITLVAESGHLPSGQEKLPAYALESSEGLPPCATCVERSTTSADTQQIAGFIIAHAVPGRAGRILTLDIVPVARRLGLGSLLMTECERQLRSFGCRQMYLETAVNNEPALRLYRKHGYQILRTLPDYYAAHSLDAFLMGKPL